MLLQIKQGKLVGKGNTGYYTNWCKTGKIQGRQHLRYKQVHS